MATTTKTTKAKTKTTSAARGSAAQAKTKTTSKSVKKPATRAKATATKTPAKTAAAETRAARPARVAGVTLDKLKRFHLIAAAVFLLLAVLAGVLMNDTSYQLTLGHMAKDELASKNATVLAPAAKALYDVEVRWVVVATMLLSLVGPLLYLTKLKAKYTNYLQNTRMQPFRWIDMAITTALIAETVALLSGVSDIMTLKLIGGLMVVTNVLGLIAERQNNAANRPVWSAYYLSLFSGALPWVLIGVYAVTTVVSGMERSPWYVYALYAAVLGGFTLLALNQRGQHRRTGKYANYLAVERNYFVVNLLAKAAFAIILIVGLSR